MNMINFIWLTIGLTIGWVLSGMFYIRRGDRMLEDYIRSQKNRG